MKRTLYIIAAAMLSFTASSCTGLLDEVNYGNPTVEEMMTNEENVVMLVGQIYADLKFTHDHWGYWGLQTITADEGICIPRTNGAHWNDGGYWLKQNTHTWDHRGDAIKNVWNVTISGAVLCNQVIETLNRYKDSMSESVYAQYLGEVEVMRSYYFYLLFDCFGRIPYTEKYEEATGPLLAPEEVWSNLVSVLERNAPNMAVVNDANRAANYGRTTQGFAYALLARLYLNAEGFGCTMDNVFKTVPKPEQFSGSFYDNCVRCCNKIIDAGSYSIENDYFANFKIFNENSKENIFVIVENGLTDDERDKGSTKNKLRIIHNTHHYGVQFYYGMILDTWNGFCARPDFLNLYADTDLRGPGNEKKGTANTKQWGWFLGPVYNTDGKTLYVDANNDEETIIHAEISNINNGHNFDGARLNKWEIDKTGTYTYCENDFPIIRYADVLWMKEEAIARGGAGASGANTEDFKRMLKRSFAYDANPEAAFQAAYGNVSSWTVDDILDERGREFTWEMVRRRDLIRFDKFDDVQYVTSATAKQAVRKWFPIPYSVLEKSLIDENGNKVWTQTPGYENL
jgi:hypothetical protein